MFKILVKPGDRVKKGQTVLVLEAMKMENEIASTADGVVSRVLVKEGQSVEADAPLLVLE